MAALVALLLVALGIGGAYVLQKRRAAEDVRGSSTEEFVVTEEPAEEPPPPPPPPKPGKPKLEVVWPTYGYDAERQRVATFGLRPPFRRVWTFKARQLLEFPPAIAYGRLYFSNNSGMMFAVSAKTGKRAWKRPIGRCVAASPAVHDGTVFQSFLNRPPCNSERNAGRLEGEVIAFAAGFGQIRWRTRLGPTRVVAARRERARLRRRLARPRLRPRRADGPRPLDVPGPGPRQGSGLALREPALRRHVQGLPLCAGSADREADLANELAGPSRRARPVLLDPGSRLRPRLPRLDRRQGLLVRRDDRKADLVAGHRRLRLLLARDLAQEGLRRLLQRALRRARRRHGRHRLELQRGRRDLRLADRDRRRRLLRHVEAAHLCARRPQRARCCGRSTDGKYTPVVADRDRLYLVGLARVYGMVER